MAARIQMPNLPYLRNRKSAPMMAAESRAVAIRYQGYWR